MAEEGKKKKKRVVKVYDPEVEYAQDMQKAVAISLLFFIVVFLSVRHMEVKAYKTRVEKATQVEEINLQVQMQETPPPVKKPAVPKEIQTAEGPETENADTNIDIGPTTFNESELPPPPSSNDTVYQFFMVQKKPALVHRVTPVYPELARKAGLEGKVIVEMIVGKNGRVESARVLKSDNEIFNQPALQAVKQYVYTPAMQNDKPVRVKVIQPIIFQLH